MHLPNLPKIRLFISYAESDEKLVEEFEKHLSAWRQRGLINIWNKSKIEAGDDWTEETEKQFQVAEIILLMVSPDFISSDELYRNEVEKALKRHESDKVTVVPIILKPVCWKATSFEKLECLPKNKEPVTGSYWKNKDEAFYNVSESLGIIIENEFRNRKHRIYESTLKEELKKMYPPDSRTISFLNKVKNELNLREGDAKIIEDEIYKRKEAEYQKNLKYYRSQYQHLRFRYLFIKDAQREQLSRLKNNLKLQEFDICRLESEYTIVNVLSDYFKKYKLLIYLLGSGCIFIFVSSWIRAIQVPINTPTLEPLSREESVQLVEKYLKAKSEIFGREPSMEAVTSTTGGDLRLRLENAIDANRSTNTFLIFEEPTISPPKYFCSLSDNKVQIHLDITHHYRQFKNGEEDLGAGQQEYSGAFGLEYIEPDQEWKIVNTATSTDMQGMNEFRSNFWGMNPQIADKTCRHITSAKAVFGNWIKADSIQTIESE